MSGVSGVGNSKGRKEPIVNRIGSYEMNPAPPEADRQPDWRLLNFQRVYVRLGAL